jgi:mono/diheme cytochrome c family protein
MPQVRGGLTVLSLCALLHAGTGVAALAAPQAAAKTARDGVYTTAQADAGKTAYLEKCASCHGKMTGATPDMAPLLNDYVFQDTWKNRSVGELFERIRLTMPQNEPATLSPQRTAEIVAYILSANELPAGDRALAEDAEGLKQIRMDAVQP